ncbi:MAG: carbonate dehydratase [Marinobacterium sp.]|nr:carbonate dehydratase [Marinobacterium sp.]
MSELEKLLNGNRQWAGRVSSESPEFFPTLAKQQSPDYLWIGCADSRVPANEIVDMLPGDIFVHRNVSNLVLHGDMNCLSVVQYAVQVLKVKQIMVVGHYGCGGVKAALEDTPLGLIGNWLCHIRDVAAKHRSLLARCSCDDNLLDRLCELNVLEQTRNLCNTTMVQEAWRSGQQLEVTGLVYGLEDGLLQELNYSNSEPGGVEQRLEAAVTMLERRCA